MKIDFTPGPPLYLFEPHRSGSHAGRLRSIGEGSGPPILFCYGNPTWSFPHRTIVTWLRGRERPAAGSLPSSA